MTLEPDQTHDEPATKRAFDPLIGARVRKLREASGMRQSDLACAAEVSGNTVLGLESGRRTQWRNIDKIARALGTTGDALARGEITIGVDDPILKNYTSEDLAIARAFHDAPTAIRSAVIDLLRPQTMAIADLLSRLSPARRATVIRLVRSMLDERNEQAHHDVRAVNHSQE